MSIYWNIFFLNNPQKKLSQRLVSDEFEADEPDTVENDAENVDLLKDPAFLPRHFQFPKAEEDALIEDHEEANGS